MDPDQTPTIVRWLKGLFTGAPKDPPEKTYLASPTLNYPTSDDVNFARKYDYSYGQPWAPEFENKSARVLTGDANKLLAGSTEPVAETFDTRRFNDPRLDKLKDYYAKAALAVENSALAKLGFDPSKTAADILKDPARVNIVGAYQPKNDQIYSNVGAPSSIVHESIHRGIKKLQDSPYWKKEFEPFGHGSNEMLVRYLMQSKMGDPERVEDQAAAASIGTDTSEGLKQQDAAASMFNPSKSSLAKTRLDLINKMEEAAANYIADKHPGGPR